MLRASGQMAGQAVDLTAVTEAAAGGGSGRRPGRAVRTGGAGAGAVHLGADQARWLIAMGRTGRARARAALRHVAVTRRGAADDVCPFELVGRTVRARARAVFRHVAVTGRRAADGVRRLELVGWAARAGARAGLGDVARPC